MSKANAKRKPAKKEQTPLSKAVLSLILTLAIGVFLISGLKLISILTTYKKAEDAYTTITHSVTTYPQGQTERDYPDIDFAALLEINPETKGYLFIKDFMEYPFVQGTDNDTYLHTLLNGEYNPSGTLFIDYTIPEGIDARNCIIYGHNMDDGSMFGPLFRYSDPEFFEEHKDVHIFTPDHHYLYRAVAVYTADVDGFTYTTSFPDDASFEAFLSQTRAASWVSSDRPLTAADHLITLSTCLDNGSDEYRNVVVLVREEEITE